MKQLSREILEKAGIYVEEDPNETCGYKIYRYGRKAGRAKELTWKRLNPCLNVKYHKKSGKMKWYWIVGFSENGEPKAYPLHRLLYAWYIGYVPANMDVDHIDNNSLNNDLSNLQLSTRKDNLAKREGFKNQWDAMKANEEVKSVDGIIVKYIYPDINDTNTNEADKAGVGLCLTTTDYITEQLEKGVDIKDIL